MSARLTRPTESTKFNGVVGKADEVGVVGEVSEVDGVYEVNKVHEVNEVYESPTIPARWRDRRAK